MPGGRVGLGVTFTFVALRQRTSATAVSYKALMSRVDDADGGKTYAPFDQSKNVWLIINETSTYISSSGKHRLQSDSTLHVRIAAQSPVPKQAQQLRQQQANESLRSSAAVHLCFQQSK